MTRRPRLPQRSPSARRGLAGGLAALVLLATAACGGSDDADSGDDPAGDADSPSAEASPGTDAEEPAGEDAGGDTGDTEDSAEGESVDAAEFARLFEDSVTQETTARIAIETSAAAGGVAGEGDIDLGTTPPSLALTLQVGQLGQGDIETRLVDGTAYVAVPQLGGKFVSFDLSDPNNPLGDAFVDQLDIGSQFESFAEFIQDVTYLGTEDVDGEELERYTLTVDGEAVEDLAGEAAGAGAPVEVPEEITYDVFFDDEGLFRRLSFDLPDGISSTITYSDWGKDVSITAPRPNQVTSMPGVPG
jgi:hypothetical protein